MLDTRDTPNRDEDEPSGGSNTKKLVLAFTAIMLIVVAVRVYFVIKQRHDAQIVHVDEGLSHGELANDRPEVDTGRDAAAGEWAGAAGYQPVQCGRRSSREGVVGPSTPGELGVKDLALP